MKILLMMAVVQSLNLVIFAWFNRVAGLRILVLRQQLTVYKRKSKKPMLRNEGLRSKAQRYAEVLGHEPAHAAVILEDPDHARLVQELDREIKQFEIHRRNRNRGAFDEEARERLNRIKSLTAEVEAMANPVEVEVWRELRESRRAGAVAELFPPRK